MRRLAVLSVFGAGLAAIAAPAQAGETLPRDIAQRLDKAPVEFSMTAAKRERLMIIQENMARQRYYGGYGYGYGTPGYGYAPYGYGDPYGYGSSYGYGGSYGYYGRHSQRPLTGLERGYYGR